LITRVAALLWVTTKVLTLPESIRDIRLMPTEPSTTRSAPSPSAREMMTSPGVALSQVDDETDTFSLELLCKSGGDHGPLGFRKFFHHQFLPRTTS